MSGQIYLSNDDIEIFELMHQVFVAQTGRGYEWAETEEGHERLCQNADKLKLKIERMQEIRANKK